MPTQSPRREAQSHIAAVIRRLRARSISESDFEYLIFISEIHFDWVGFIPKVFFDPDFKPSFQKGVN